jgi:hypothetical protein
MGKLGTNECSSPKFTKWHNMAYNYAFFFLPNISSLSDPTYNLTSWLGNICAFPFAPWLVSLKLATLWKMITKHVVLTLKFRLTVNYAFAV